jgi:hypothetical protein
MMPVSAVSKVDAGPKRVVRRVLVNAPTTEVTETFNCSTHKAPALLELFGMHKQNADGITSTLERLAARFGG